jgi:DNA replication protein DnaC
MKGGPLEAMITASIVKIEECTICGGTGWKPVLRGGNNFYTECECLQARIKGERASLLVQRSGLRGSLLGKTFENYCPMTKKQKEALEKVKTGGSFFLIGPPGVGKSHLLGASVNDALKNETRAVFFSAPWLMKMIRKDILNGEKEEILEKCCEVDYLAVDDLGKEKPTETVQEKLFMIFDRREVDGLRTSVTSNLGPNTLSTEKLDGAIVSRIMGMCELIVLDGNDYRLASSRMGCKYKI